MKGHQVLRSTKTQAVKDSAVSAAELARSLAKDKKFRKQLLSAISHGTIAQRRASKRIGFVAAVTRLGADQKLKSELRKMTKHLENAWGRVEKKRSHKLRNSFLVVAGVGGAAFAATKARKGGLPNVGIVGGGTTPRTITESIEVDVPVSTAYNQWTQFEDFPLFMEGVEHVEQLDDTRLHWVAKRRRRSRTLLKRRAASRGGRLRQGSVRLPRGSIGRRKRPPDPPWSPNFLAGKARERIAEPLARTTNNHHSRCTHFCADG
jgi:hypothetical protein